LKTSHLLFTVAVIGGTGKEGKGLVFRLARAGYKVLIGSRSLKKARSNAAEFSQNLGSNVVIYGFTNISAARKADIVILAVPFSAHKDILENIRKAMQGKLLIDATVPLVPPNLSKVQMPPAGSAAQEAHEILGDGIQVTTAFQNISSASLMEEGTVDCDVLVSGTSEAARSETIKLVTTIGFTGWDAGPIENSAVVEGLTSVLIGINKKYKSTSAGIRISGVNNSAVSK
jgi:NADPH-dependent F420 reductase